jgi:hypothetical protein
VFHRRNAQREGTLAKSDAGCRDHSQIKTARACTAIAILNLLPSHFGKIRRAWALRSKHLDLHPAMKQPWAAPRKNFSR